jgi:small conductance mechanosensitive channel
MLRDLRGVLHIIPNGQIAAVSNFTRSWSRAVVEVSVAYSANVDHAIAVLQDEAERFAADAVWQARLEGAPDVLGVEQLGENGVTIRALLRTVPGAQWEVGREFRRRIKNRLDREGIEMSYPQRVVHLRQAAGPTETMRADQGEGE